MFRNHSEQYIRIIGQERRIGQRDRRLNNTYIADDRRNGIADRRKPRVYRLKRLRTEDRRQLHTYIANDRRSGIADRRDPKRIIPSWWRFNFR
jgi:hypothetical protein